MAEGENLPSGTIPLNIPPPVVPGLNALGTLPEDSAHHLLAAVHEGPADVLHARFASDVRVHLGGGGPEVPVELIIQSLISLTSGQQLSGMTAHEFAAGIAHSPQLDLDTEQRLYLSRLLPQFFREKPLILTSKAWDILTENERNFIQARSVTDLRPVFVEVDEAPPACVIVHTLKISFADKAGAAGEVHISLDDVDIRRLQEVLSRATAKSESLRAMMAEVAPVMEWELP